MSLLENQVYAILKMNVELDSGMIKDNEILKNINVDIRYYLIQNDIFDLAEVFNIQKNQKELDIINKKENALDKYMEDLIKQLNIIINKDKDIFLKLFYTFFTIENILEEAYLNDKCNILKSDLMLSEAKLNIPKINNVVFDYIPTTLKSN